MRLRPRALVHGLLVAATLAALAPVAQAQYFGRNKVRYDDFDFRVLETEHFDLYYYEGMETAANDVGRMAERWYDRLSAILRHEFDERKSIILYADDADFRQTNIANIGEGTQGVTEGARQRVVLPMAGTYAQTDHVLGHELVHQFQFDIALRAGRFAQFVRLPLFFIEGMAEYYSVGREDALTSMWMRDAILRSDFPTVGDLQRSGAFNEYQYGQPFWAYLAGEYGDEAGIELFAAALDVPLDSAIVEVTGVSPDTLSARWRRAIRASLVPPAEGRTVPLPPRTEDELEAIAEERRDRREARAAGERPRRPRFLAYPDSFPQINASRLLARERETGNINIAPQLSPDGRYVAYLSELDLFGIDLFLADAETGEVLTKLQSVGSDPHFDALRFLESAGTWSPDGTQFAYVVFAGGDNEIAVLDVERRDLVRRLTVEGIGAIKDPAWSPDGTQIAFSGVKGGITDLYTVDVGGETDGTVRQLTNDRFADLQPAWSPDGTQIAFVTDRGPGTDFVRLTFDEMGLALYDVATDEITTLDVFAGDKHINPAWSPDGASLYFISDRGGFNDVYRLDRASGEVFKVTNLATGVSGISDLSPALSVADRTGDLAFSVFEAQRYTVYRLAAAEAEGEPLEPVSLAEATADVLPPAGAFAGSTVQGYLADVTGGLPANRTFPTRGYRPKLSLDYISQPQIGAGYQGGVGGGFGLAGGISFLFSDQLSDNVLGVAVAANGTLQDIGGQVLYLNRGGRVTYGSVAGHVPLLFRFVGTDPTGRYRTIYNYRQFSTQLSGLASYALNQSQRFEANAGARRLGYDIEYLEAEDINGDGFIDRFTRYRDLDDLETSLFGDLSPLYLAEGGVAFVGDRSFSAFTSPISGARYRFGIDGTFGSLNFGTVTADYRRYVRFRPPGLPRRAALTFAVRALHLGRYGGGAGDERIGPISVGFSQAPLVRGYGYNSLIDDINSEEELDEFQDLQDRIFGTRIGVANAELRIPLLGVPQLGLISFPYLPIELVAFADAGAAWGRFESRNLFTTDQDGLIGQEFGSLRPVVSAGFAARVNVLGALIVEPYYAFPFSREDESAVFGLALTSGW
jgi:hypothetical protein